LHCEFRSHGEFGVEAQFFNNGEFSHNRRFDAARVVLAPHLGWPLVLPDWPITGDAGENSCRCSERVNDPYSPVVT